MIGVEEAQKFLPALPAYIAVNINQLKDSLEKQRLSSVLAQVALQQGTSVEALLSPRE